MLKFALKNMAVKKIQAILIVLSITLSAGVAVLAYNTAEQVSDGITQTAAYYSDIIGPAGSATQLAMNTMYFTDEPLGTIPFELVEELRQDDRVKQAIPFAMADSYNGYRVVGTESAYLSTKSIRDGRMFNDVGNMEVVLGYNVAKVCQLEVGTEIFTSHSSGEEHKQALTVVGIMDQTHTAYDNVLFTQIQTIWAVHEEEHEEHDHEEMRGMVCAILVTAKNPSYAMVLANEYDSAYTDADGASFALQAIEPMAVIRSVLEDTNTTKYIVYLLCGIILAMNIIIISVITLLNMYHSAKEISLMRLIGISMKRINLLYLIQNGIIGLASVLLAFGLSRLCLGFMGDYVAKMGVVLNPGKVYPMEWIILLAVFIISILPTLICTSVMSKRDGIND